MSAPRHMNAAPTAEQWEVIIEANEVAWDEYASPLERLRKVLDWQEKGMLAPDELWDELVLVIGELTQPMNDYRYTMQVNGIPGYEDCGFEVD